VKRVNGGSQTAGIDVRAAQSVDYSADRPVGAEPVTTVVKLGGRVQGDPALPAALARAWRRAEGALVVVHGGGDEVTALQRRLGQEPTFVGGRRVTAEGDMDALRMVLSGLANKRLVAALVGEGVQAVGVSGEDAGIIAAEPDGRGLGLVGRPTSVNVRILRHLLIGGYLPVVSPLARGEGGPLNVNGDDAASAIAAALGGSHGGVELLLLSDVPGVLLGGVPAPALDAAAAMAAIGDGSATGGMAAKLEAAAAALAGGVAQVRIGDLTALDDRARGTVVTQTKQSRSVA
jgi:acetylglutamate kinase